VALAWHECVRQNPERCNLALAAAIGKRKRSTMTRVSTSTYLCGKNAAMSLPVHEAVTHLLQVQTIEWADSLTANKVLNSLLADCA
jgi:hypothetical protein